MMDCISVSINSDDGDAGPATRPILVGYAFGKKKMKTMGIIMAEASRAVATVLASSLPESFQFSISSLNQQKDDEEKFAGVRSNNTPSLVTLDETSSSFSRTSSLQTKHSTQSNRLIRVSFVPLDMDSPLEEQHGGKFDAILHKLTEDILCVSQLDFSSPSYPKFMQEPFIAKYNPKVMKMNTRTFQPDQAPINTTPLSLTESQNHAIERIERLNDYKRLYPSCCLIDHPADIQSLMCRADMARILSKCLHNVTTKSGISVSTPSFLVIQNKSQLDSIFERHPSSVTPDVNNLPFTFPFIVKPLAAAGTTESHKMAIITSSLGIPEIEPPCLLQEYANHDGILFKVYVLGNIVKVFPRASLPNLPVGEKKLRQNSNKKEVHYDNRQESSQPSLYETDGEFSFVKFDSQRAYPKLSDFGIKHSDNIDDFVDRKETLRDIEGPDKKRQKIEPCMSVNHNLASPIPPDMISADEIKPIASVIRKSFGVELFGFDILVVDNNIELTPNCVKKSPLCDTTKSIAKKKKMLVVDVNYFPSYKEMSDSFPSMLAQYLTKKAINGRIQEFHQNP